MFSVDRPALALVSLLISAGCAVAQDPAPDIIENGAIASPLTGERGDPARGRKIVAERQKGLCLLCHQGPFPEERFQGDLAPTLAGAGSRLSEGELRLRLVDGTKVNPKTIMPSYYRADHLQRVAPAFAGRTLLTAAEIEDVVAFLSTLRDEAKAGNPSKEAK
jgi:sulfur-oxidizing protein SoxX